MTKRSTAGPITLRRYRDQQELDESLDGDGLPLGAHAVYTAWAADALRDEDVEVEIVWADQAA